ncbi:MAG TPA: SPFH domain-containing protein [Xanthomonadaceae bacterium]|nr:SPFH domain-containing protein [Xanthomonadaceae bacterium]
MNVSLAFVALTTLAALLLVMRRVPEGQAWTVHRFGRYVRTLEPGRHAVWPVVDRIAQHVPLTGHHIELPTRAFGADRASADLYYQILDPMPTGDGLETVDEMVLRQADDALSSVVAELPSQRPDGSATLADALKAELNRRLGSKGLRVIRCALHAS